MMARCTITLYIVHFWQPFGSERHSARHYVGATKDLSRRIAEHRRGVGKGIMAYAKRAGLKWTWDVLKYDASWDDERRIKRSGHYERVCPFCRGDVSF